MVDSNRIITFAQLWFPCWQAYVLLCILLCDSQSQKPLHYITFIWQTLLSRAIVIQSWVDQHMADGSIPTIIMTIMTNPRSTFLSHLSSSSFGLCLGPCGSPSFAGGSLQVPACLQHSGCLWAADTGLGKTAARRTVSGPETLYSLGEACCLDHRVRTCICRRKTAFFQKTEYEKLLFILLAHFNPWLSGWSTKCVRYTAYIYSTRRLTLHRLSNES